jgi:hypothetical protein
VQNYQKSTKSITFERYNSVIPMSRLKYFMASAALLLSVLSGAHTKDKSKVSFAYDVDFSMQFDNREFYRSAFTSSMTIFGARLTPSVGLAVRQNDGTCHKLMAGIDVMKDFGRSPVSPERRSKRGSVTTGSLPILSNCRTAFPVST